MRYQVRNIVASFLLAGFLRPLIAGLRFSRLSRAIRAKGGVAGNFDKLSQRFSRAEIAKGSIDITFNRAFKGGRGYYQEIISLSKFFQISVAIWKSCFSPAILFFLLIFRQTFLEAILLSPFLSVHVCVNVSRLCGNLAIP